MRMEKRMGLQAQTMVTGIVWLKWKYGYLLRL